MKKKNRVKYSISFKFITIFAILLSFFFALSTFMFYYFLGTDLNKKEISLREEQEKQKSSKR